MSPPIVRVTDAVRTQAREFLDESVPLDAFVAEMIQVAVAGGKIRPRRSFARRGRRVFWVELEPGVVAWVERVPRRPPGGAENVWRLHSIERVDVCADSDAGRREHGSRGAVKSNAGAS